MEEEKDKKDGIPPQYTKAKANLAEIMEEVEELEDEDVPEGPTDELDEEFNELLQDLDNPTSN